MGEETRWLSKRGMRIVLTVSQLPVGAVELERREEAPPQTHCEQAQPLGKGVQEFPPVLRVALPRNMGGAATRVQVAVVLEMGTLGRAATEAMAPPLQVTRLGRMAPPVSSSFSTSIFGR